MSLTFEEFSRLTPEQKSLFYKKIAQILKEAEPPLKKKNISALYSIEGRKKLTTQIPVRYPFDILSKQYQQNGEINDNIQSIENIIFPKISFNERNVIGKRNRENKKRAFNKATAKMIFDEKKYFNQIPPELKQKLLNFSANTASTSNPNTQSTIPLPQSSNPLPELTSQNTPELPANLTKEWNALQRNLKNKTSSNLTSEEKQKLRNFRKKMEKLGNGSFKTSLQSNFNQTISSFNPFNLNNSPENISSYNRIIMTNSAANLRGSPIVLQGPVNPLSNAAEGAQTAASASQTAAIATQEAVASASKSAEGVRKTVKYLQKLEEVLKRKIAEITNNNYNFEYNTEKNENINQLSNTLKEVLKAKKSALKEKIKQEKTVRAAQTAENIARETAAGIVRLNSTMQQISQKVNGIEQLRKNLSDLTLRVNGLKQDVNNLYTRSPRPVAGGLKKKRSKSKSKKSSARAYKKSSSRK